MVRLSVISLMPKGVGSWKNHRWSDTLRNVPETSLDRNVAFRLIDARGVPLGPLAEGIASALIGKDKVTSRSNVDQGDVIVVINAAHLVVTDKTLNRKRYYWHTGYPGGLRVTKLPELLETKPTEEVRKAVYRMLPRNTLMKLRLRKLRIFPGEEHPFEDRVETKEQELALNKALVDGDVDGIARAVQATSARGAAASVLPWSARALRERFAWVAHKLPAGFVKVEHLEEGWTAT